MLTVLRKLIPLTLTVCTKGKFAQTTGMTACVRCPAGKSNLAPNPNPNPNPDPNPSRQQLCGDSGLIDFYTLMNPSEPWEDNDDGLRFLCCVARVPSVIPGTSANALHVSKVRRHPCAFEVPLVGC